MPVWSGSEIPVMLIPLLDDQIDQTIYKKADNLLKTPERNESSVIF